MRFNPSQVRINCPECNAPVTLTTKECASCGYPIETWFIDILIALLPRFESWDRGSIAENPSTPEEMLRALSLDENSDVRASVAGNPGTPTDLLRELINEEDWSIRNKAAGNPNLPADILQKLAKDEDEYLRNIVAENPNTPAGALRELIHDDSGNARMGAAENPNLPEEVFESIASDDDVFLRAGAAGNPNLPEALLRKLAYDDDEWVRSKALRNPATPKDVLRTVASSGDDGDRGAALSNTNMPEDVLREFSRNTDVNIRKNVAGNPSLPEDVLRQLARDQDAEIRRSVARNPSIPEDTLSILVNDADPGVSLMAGLNSSMSDGLRLERFHSDGHLTLQEYSRPCLIQVLYELFWNVLGQSQIDFIGREQAHLTKERTANGGQAAVDMNKYFEAAGGGNDSLLQEFLDRPGFDVNSTDIDGDTALLWATSRQRVSTVRILLNHGADPNIAGVSGSPLRTAAALGNRELVDMLLENGAIIDSDWSMSTPLSMAMKQGQFDMVKYLLSRGANPNQASGNMNETPLMGAAMMGNLDLVRTLINCGANVNSRDVDGDTPIVYLTIGRSMNTQVAKELLLNGASIDELYSHGHVFMRMNYDGSMGIYLREAVTRSVLYDDNVSLSMMFPGAPDYYRYCY